MYSYHVEGILDWFHVFLESINFQGKDLAWMISVPGDFTEAKLSFAPFEGFISEVAPERFTS
jgi:hypothetical protein